MRKSPWRQRALGCGLVLAIPLLSSAYQPAEPTSAASTNSVKTTTVGGTAVPGVGSTEQLGLPRDARVRKAELRWDGVTTPWCASPVGDTKADSVDDTKTDETPALRVGGQRVVADQVDRDAHGYTARADITRRLPGVLDPDGDRITVRSPWHEFARSCFSGFNNWSLHLEWDSPRPSITVRTTASEERARPGDHVTQTAVLTNDGQVPLTGITADLSIGPCRSAARPLEPGTSATVTCTGELPKTGRMTANVRASGIADGPVSDADATRVVLSPPPRTELEITTGEVTYEPGADVANAAVTVRNASSVALSDVSVHGTPASCRRDLGELGPGETINYTCPVHPTDTVALHARGSAESDVVASEVTRTVPVAIPVPRPPPRDPPPAPRDPPPQPQAWESTQEQDDSPERAAGFISITAVVVMMVTVGGLSAATRRR